MTKGAKMVSKESDNDRLKNLFSASGRSLKTETVKCGWDRLSILSTELSCP